MSGVLTALAALGYGLASAFVPFLNAEAIAVVAGHRASYVVVTVIALALGQASGKLVIFEAARRGSQRWGHAAKRPVRWTKPFRRWDRSAKRAARWAKLLQRWLSRRRTGLPTVFVSAAIGLPPLAMVSLAAGTAGLRHWEFAAVCWTGRLLRFAALAVPAGLLW